MKLPELPPSFDVPPNSLHRVYTADQMRAYGALVREMCAKVLDERVLDCREDFSSDGDERWLVYAKHAERLAATIRRKD